MPLFVLEYRFSEAVAERLAVRPRHRAFLEELKSRGKLVAAGPWRDDSGACSFTTLMTRLSSSAC